MTKTARLTTIFDADSRPLKREIAEVRAAGKRLSGAFKAPPGLGKLTNFATGMAKAVGSRMLTLGFYGAAAGIAGVTRETLTFDNSLQRAFANLRAGGQVGADTYDRLYKSTYDVGKSTEFTSGQAAEAASRFAQAGYNIGEIGTLLPKTADLASAAGVDIATAADWATTALTSFGLKIDGMPEKTAKNFGEVSDIISVVVAQGKLDFADFNNTLTYAGQSAAGLKLEFRDTAATIGLMSMMGLKASKAGTNIRRIYESLANPTAKAAEMMEKLGVSAWNQDGSFKGITATFIELNKAMDKQGLSLRERNAAMSTLVPITAKPGAMGLSNMKVQDIQKYLTIMEKTNGATQDMANIVRGSLVNRFKLLWSAITALGTTVLTKYRKEIDAFIGSAIEWVNSIDPDDVAFYFKQVWSGIKEMIPAIKGAMPDLKELTKSVIAFGVQLMKVVGPALSAITPHLDKLIMLWVGKQGTDAIIAIGDMASAIGSLASGLKLVLPALFAVAAVTGPWVVVFALLAGIIAICASQWDTWIANLRVSEFQRLAQYMYEIREVVKDVAGFFGFGMFDKPMTRKQTYEAGRSQWESEHEGIGGGRFDDIRFWDEMPQSWIDEQRLKMGGASGDWQTRLGWAPSVPVGMSSSADVMEAYRNQPKMGDLAGPGVTEFIDRLSSKMTMAAPIINVTANDGVQVKTSVDANKNTSNLYFNGKGKN